MKVRFIFFVFILNFAFSQFKYSGAIYLDQLLLLNRVENSKIGRITGEKSVRLILGLKLNLSSGGLLNPEIRAGFGFPYPFVCVSVLNRFSHRYDERLEIYISSGFMLWRQYEFSYLQFAKSVVYRDFHGWFEVNFGFELDNFNFEFGFSQNIWRRKFGSKYDDNYYPASSTIPRSLSILLDKFLRVGIGYVFKTK